MQKSLNKSQSIRSIGSALFERTPSLKNFLSPSKPKTPEDGYGKAAWDWWEEDGEDFGRLSSSTFDRVASAGSASGKSIHGHYQGE